MLFSLEILIINLSNTFAMILYYLFSFEILAIGLTFLGNGSLNRFYERMPNENYFRKHEI